MFDFLFSVIGFLIAITILVAVHEFGHYWVAKRCGVKVLRFAIGFGRPIWSKTWGKDKTEFVFAAIPLGGYVKMLGEGDPDAVVEEHEKHRAFDCQALWKKALIVSAGPAINFLFAIVLLMVLAFTPSEKLKPVIGDLPSSSVLAKSGVVSGDIVLTLNGRPVDYFSQRDLYLVNQLLSGKQIILEIQSGQTIKKVTIETKDIPIYNISPSYVAKEIGLFPVLPEVTTQISQVLKQAPAEKAGLKVNDVIIGINGKRIDTWSQLVHIISQSANSSLLLDIERNDVRLQVPVVPQERGVQNEVRGYLGIAPTVLPLDASYYIERSENLIAAGMSAVEEVWLVSSVSLKMLAKMLTLQVSHKNINGPVTMAQVTGEAAQVGIAPYLYILAMISITLGVMNLLPIPVLDGGHLMMYLYEFVSGKPLSEEMMLIAHKIGILLLMGLMSLAFYNDIFRLLH